MQKLKCLWFLIGMTLAFTPAVPVFSQSYQGSTEIVLHLKETLISGNTVKIGYMIPYDGYIEFYLYNLAGERVWYTSFVKEKGEHYLAINRTKMEAGTIFTFDFWYKGKRYSGNFKNT